MRSLFCGAIIIGVGLGMTPGTTFAWGDEGHEIIGLIANHYLSAKTRAKVAGMLNADVDPLTKHDIANEATWADKYRDENNRHDHYTQTRNWHFVDLEIASPDLKAACFGEPPLPTNTPASSGPPNDCVVDKVNQFAAELNDPATTTAERLVALKFLLHFVGDLHQPLHSSDNHDQGGNAVRISGAHSTNLHAFWDTDAVQALGTDPATVANTLIAKITASQAAQWAAGAPSAWAQEAFGIARTSVYGTLPSATQRQHQLTPAYIKSATKIASTQLSRAGVRLAFVISQALEVDANPKPN